MEEARKEWKEWKEGQKGRIALKRCGMWVLRCGCVSLLFIVMAAGLIELSERRGGGGVFSWLAVVPMLSGMFLVPLYFIGYAADERERERERKQEFAVRQRMRAYADGDATVTQQVHDYALEHFRRRINNHRHLTLGSSSEWARARAPLAEALDNANKSVAYWRERLKSDPDNEVAAHQYNTVKALEDKLGSALTKVDERADLLLKFYNECEAKLAVMDRCNQDIQETRKVEALSQQAGTVIAQAEGAIQALGRSFVEEAQKIARALGDTAGAQYKILAGDASLDNIDYVADKIVECSDSEQKQIQDMQRALAE